MMKTKMKRQMSPKLHRRRQKLQGVRALLRVPYPVIKLPRRKQEVLKSKAISVK